MSEHKLGPRLVHAWIELEAAALRRVINGPSRKNFGSLGDVALRVTAIYAQRVQLQQFAAVLFIEPGGALASLWPRPRITVRVRTGMRRNSQSPRRVRTHAQPVVQVKQHRRTF